MFCAYFEKCEQCRKGGGEKTSAAVCIHGSCVPFWKISFSFCSICRGFRGEL